MDKESDENNFMLFLFPLHIAIEEKIEEKNRDKGREERERERKEEWERRR